VNFAETRPSCDPSYQMCSANFRRSARGVSCPPRPGANQFFPSELNFRAHLNGHKLQRAIESFPQRLSLANRKMLRPRILVPDQFLRQHTRARISNVLWNGLVAPRSFDSDLCSNCRLYGRTPASSVAVPVHRAEGPQQREGRNFPPSGSPLFTPAQNLT